MTDYGPCTAWIDGADVAECCDVDAGSDGSLFDSVALNASQLLFELSGRLFTGACEQNVRPCNLDTPCGFQTLSRGHIISSPWAWDGWHWRGGAGLGCGCRPLSQILLPGYPISAVAEVKIDGVVIDSDGYRLDRKRWLTRMADADGKARLWPSCQRQDLPDTEPGTFSITYTSGADPPDSGVEAAKQLACELYKACPNTAGECKLPAGTVRVIRQGITVERQTISTFLRNAQTGLVLVDAFLAAYGSRSQRRPAVWGPDAQEFARPS